MTVPLTTASDRPVRPAPDTLVVGIGASAGGLEALEHFFQALPDDSPFAYVVIQHLSPDFRSLMDEILSRYTRLTIRRAEDGMAVESGCIYLIPPKKDMTVEEGRLYLTDKDPTRPLEMPIDIFFRSLAHYAGERAVAVILSGTGTDGSRGIVDVHEAGGLVLVQSPETAKFDGMPRSALETNVADMSLPPEAMPEIIAEFAEKPESVQRELQSFPYTAPADVREGAMALDLLKQQFGVDFSLYKQTTIGRRLARRMALRQIPSLDEYLGVLQTSPEELGELSRDLLIGVTSFFRDADAFNRLEAQVLPELLRKFADQEEFRVWVAGCATGEEVYSLAMLLREEADRQAYAGKIVIFATDVHRQCLDAAALGVFDASRLVGMPEDRRARFFREDGAGQCRVTPDLRSMVVFAAHNVLNDPPFTRMHLVSCRNMLIYLKPKAQDKVIAMFHFALHVGGILFLGASESPGSLGAEFETMDSKLKFYRKLRDVKLDIDMRLTAPEQKKLRGTGSRAQVAMDRVLLRDYDLLLERHLPTGVLVDQNREVLHYFGQVSRYLPRLAGRAGRDVLEMLDGDLRLALSAALHRAASETGRIVFRHVRVETPEGEEWVDLSVEGLRDDKVGPQHFHVVFSPVVSASEEEVAVSSASELFSPTDGAWERIRTLETELQTTRENLQATIEELQTTNEELQATNEEMLAANEELQSTNEELHSVNEELYTVNAEFEKKNKELRELNEDHDNLLRSTDVGTLFLDENLCIRRFNPAINRSFKLLAQDIGRPVNHIAYQLGNAEELYAELRAVLEGAPGSEREISVRPGEFLLRRILPFLDSTGGIRGVVMTFTDVSRIKEAEEARHQYRLIRNLASSVPGLVFQFEGDEGGTGAFTFISDGVRHLLGESNSLRLDQSAGITEFVHEDDVPAFGDAMRHALRDGGILDMEHKVRGLDACWVHTRCTPRRLEDGTVSWNGVCVDITGRKRANEEIAQAAEFYLNILNSAPALIWRSDDEGRCDWFNASWLQFTGRSLDEEMGLGWTRNVHPDDFDRCVQTYTSHFAERKPFEIECRLLRHDGEYRWILDIGVPFRSISGEFGGFIGYCFDITAQLALRDDLASATTRAQEASQAKSAFLANMSHEIRTPLNGIMGMLQLLQLAPLEDVQAEYVQTALGSCSRLGRLLSDILDLSRVEAGKLTILEEPFDLHATMGHVHDLFAPAAGGKDLDFTFNIDPDVPQMVSGDSTRLQQILGNLLGNAFKFTNAGHIRVEISRLPFAPGGRCRLLFGVVDTGIGIPEDKIVELFKPFVQVGDGYARRYQGAGLGLSICNHLVSLMQGTISIDSAPDDGTAIYFSALVKDAPEDALRLRERGDEKETPAGVRVLLAEDDEVSCFAVQSILKSSGCEVSVARDGCEALEMLRQEDFDLVLMDVQMPFMDGVTATKAIRAGQGGRRDIPIVALTAYAMASDRENFLKAGMDDYLAKPVDIDAVRRVVRRYGGHEGGLKTG